MSNSWSTPSLRVLAVLGVMALPATTRANGNVSHQWVTHAAIDATPEGGSLRLLVDDASLRPMLDTGTMFPDWGYTPGATAEERDAGEASHWEPVQDAYREWILANYAPPWSDDARRHLAFYLGMTSHGMADQSYDAMFFERSEFYDPVDHSAFDQDTDVMWAATTGPGMVPRAWIPAAPMLELFQSVVGVGIDEPSMTQQVGFVGVGIAGVNVLADDPVQVAAAEADYPWAATHDDDPAVPGNPPHEAEIVRRYWRSNWALLHGDALPRPVLWTYPADGSPGHETTATSIESWISVVFARALSAAALDVASFHVVDSAGGEVPLQLQLFYGDGSHVVHLRPMADLLPDEVYVVTVDPDVATIHGESLPGWSFTFSTGERAVPPLNDDGVWDVPDPYGDDVGGTGGEDTSGGSVDETGAAGSTSAVGTSSSGETSSTSGSTGTGAAPGDGDSGGCGCVQSGHGRTSGGFFMLALVCLGGPAPRARGHRTRRRDTLRRGVSS